MNEIRPFPQRRPTTQTADGLPRIKWTVEEFDSMTAHGFFTENDRIELLGGEFVPMSPKGNRHEIVRDELQDFIIQRLPREARISSEIGWRPDPHSYLEPDILLYPRGFIGNSVPPAEVLLLIEVADTSLAYDSGLKAKIYAKLGVREYWVVNAKTLETTVHRDPQGENYTDVRVVAKADAVTPGLLPALGLSLGVLKVE